MKIQLKNSISIIKNVLFAITVNIVIYGGIFCEQKPDSLPFQENRSVQQAISSSKKFEGEIFLSSEKEFAGEAFNIPYIVRVNSQKEILVNDFGNKCIYQFKDDGRFVRKIGKSGQGPGEILFPAEFNVGPRDFLYIFDPASYRLTVFDEIGEYATSFRVSNSGELKFSVSSDREIIFNIPKRGFLFTVYDLDGNITKEFGKVRYYEGLKKYDSENYGYGWPIRTDDGKYYLFLRYLPIVKIFNSNGSFLKNIVLTYPEMISDKFDYPRDNYSPTRIRDLNLEILYRNNKFYQFMYNTIGTDIDKSVASFTVNMMILSEDIVLLDRIYLPTSEDILVDARLRFRPDLTKDGKEIIMPLVKNAEILRYHK